MREPTPERMSSLSLEVCKVKTGRPVSLRNLKEMMPFLGPSKAGTHGVFTEQATAVGTSVHRNHAMSVNT